MSVGRASAVALSHSFDISLSLSQLIRPFFLGGGDFSVLVYNLPK